MTDFTALLPALRSALFVPASNARAIEKARGLDARMVILDLEDSVRDEDKDAAREAAIAAVAEGFGEGRLAAIRINGGGSPFHGPDLTAVTHAAVPIVVVPKVERPEEVDYLTRRAAKRVFAMIETPAGLLAASRIAAMHGMAGLIAGTNDIAAALRLPSSGGGEGGGRTGGRTGLGLALQTIVLAARAAGIAALDGVYNRLDDPEGFAAECREGRALGFDGKTLIHPSQIDPCNAAFGPTAEELEDARALVAAATGGAERFRGRMIEAMHVEAARRLLAEG